MVDLLHSELTSHSGLFLDLGIFLLVPFFFKFLVVSGLRPFVVDTFGMAHKLEISS